MEQSAPDRSHSAPLTAPSPVLRLAAVVLYCAVAVVIVGVLLARSYRPEVVPVLAVVVLVLLAFLIVLNARFLSLARRKHRATRGALYISEREFQSVFENALDGILLFDDQDRCRAANPAALRVLGTSPEQLIGKPLASVFASVDGFAQRWSEALRQPDTRGLWELRRQDQLLVLESTVSKNYLPGKHLMILRDVTQRRRAEVALLESEERFRQMAENIQEVFWMLDPASRKPIYLSRAFESLTGQPPESIINDPSLCRGWLHGEDRERILRRLKEAFQTGEFDEQFRILPSDGRLRWVAVRGFPVHDADGAICRIVGTAQDITAQKEAEEQVATNLALARSAWAEADALRKASLALTQDLRMDYVLDTLLESIRSLVPYQVAQVWLLEADTRLFLTRETVQSGGEQPVPGSALTLDSTSYPAVERALASQRGISIADTTKEPKWEEFEGRAYLRCWLFVPLWASQRVLGLLALGHQKPNSFTEEHLRMTGSLAVAAAVAIQNARLYERAEIYAAELEKRLADLREAQQALQKTERDRASGASSER